MQGIEVGFYFLFLNLDPFSRLEMTKSASDLPTINRKVLSGARGEIYARKVVLWCQKFVVGNDLSGVLRQSLENIMRNYTSLGLARLISSKSTRCFSMQVISFIFITPVRSSLWQVSLSPFYGERRPGAERNQSAT